MAPESRSLRLTDATVPLFMPYFSAISASVLSASSDNPRITIISEGRKRHMPLHWQISNKNILIIQRLGVGPKQLTYIRDILLDQTKGLKKVNGIPNLTDLVRSFVGRGEVKPKGDAQLRWSPLHPFSYSNVQKYTIQTSYESDVWVTRR